MYFAFLSLFFVTFAYGNFSFDCYYNLKKTFYDGEHYVEFEDYHYGVGVYFMDCVIVYKLLLGITHLLLPIHVNEVKNEEHSENLINTDG